MSTDQTTARHPVEGIVSHDLPLVCDDCGALNAGVVGDRCPEIGPCPENGRHVGYLVEPCEFCEIRPPRKSGRRCTECAVLLGLTRRAVRRETLPRFECECCGSGSYETNPRHGHRQCAVCAQRGYVHMHKRDD